MRKYFAGILVLIFVWLLAGISFAIDSTTTKWRVHDESGANGWVIDSSYDMVPLGANNIGDATHYIDALYVSSPTVSGTVNTQPTSVPNIILGTGGAVAAGTNGSIWYDGTNLKFLLGETTFYFVLSSTGQYTNPN